MLIYLYESMCAHADNTSSFIHIFILHLKEIKKKIFEKNNYTFVANYIIIYLKSAKHILVKEFYLLFSSVKVFCFYFHKESEEIICYLLYLYIHALTIRSISNASFVIMKYVCTFFENCTALLITIAINFVR